MYRWCRVAISAEDICVLGDGFIIGALRRWKGGGECNVTTRQCVRTVMGADGPDGPFAVGHHTPEYPTTSSGTSSDVAAAERLGFRVGHEVECRRVHFMRAGSVVF